MASGETYTRLREQSFTSSPCFKRVKTKTRVSHHPHPSPATTLYVPPRNTPPRQLLRSPLNFPRLSTPDPTFMVEAALAGKERRAEPEPTSRCAHRPSIPCLHLPFNSLPFSDEKGATQPAIHSFSTKGEREGAVVNSYGAGSFARFADFPRD